MLFSILIASFIQAQLSISGWAGEGLKLPCKARRTEIVFPQVHDFAGRVTFSALGNDDNRQSALLHATIRWRRRKLETVLYQNQVTSDQTHSEWTEGNLTYALSSHRDCFYRGYIKGQKSSFAAISACEGLAGFIQTEEELLYIQPAARSIATDDLHLAHILYTCEPRYKPVAEPDWETESTARHIGRKRRAAKQPKYLEVMVAVDHTVVNEIGSKERTQDYVMVLMNIANTVYQHYTLGVDIKVVVVKINFLTKRQQGQVLTRNDAHRTVNQFCEWSKRRIPVGQEPHFDISVLITKEKLGPSGYAPITGLCIAGRSCAAVREEGFSTGFIIAHEMAHVFGLFHDGHGNNCHGLQFQNAMMAPLVESKLNRFWWSSCSSRRMKEMVPYLRCLNNVPEIRVANHYSLKATSKFSPKLGRPYSLDFQCKMEFGTYFRVCPHVYGDPCHTLWCSSAPQRYMCRTKRGPPMPGTKCGYQRECKNERCQYVGNQRPVDGVWGHWISWSDCTTGCGVGIRRRSRVCDSPAPAYDGKECAGADNQWETCVNKTCESYNDNRVGECAVWDGLQIRYGTHKWQPFQSDEASSQCKQTCQSSYTREVVTIEVNVDDGTPCSYTGNNSNICQEGECLMVGCDGKINSTKIEDMCGVCGGDGSTCKVVEGTIMKAPKSMSEYIPIVTLPSGSRDIHIEETIRSAQFFALVDPRYGSFVFGGNNKQPATSRFVYAGAMFEYKRDTPSLNESLTSPGPLKADIKVMLYPNRVMQNTSVLFRYSVPQDDFTFEKDKFTWKFKTWSECSVTCGAGKQTIVHKCVEIDSGEETDESHCSILKAPRKDTVRCTRQNCGLIRYNYAMLNDFDECNAQCGKSGTQTQMYYCERAESMTGVYTPVYMEFCAHLEPPKIVRRCQAGPCNGSVHFQWLISETWSDCPCGENNIQTRNITCQKVTIKITSEGKIETVEETDKMDCEKLPEKPPKSRSCNGLPCEPIFRWIITDSYSQCDAACGEIGQQVRELVCEQVTFKTLSGATEEILEQADDQFCSKIQKPEVDIRACDGDPCPTPATHFQWLVSETWSDCPCGNNNTQTRNVTCQIVTTKMVSEGKVKTVEDTDTSECDQLPEKPSTSRPCNGLPCEPVFRWITTDDYSLCDAACGETGQQVRELVCERVTFKKLSGEIKEVLEQTDNQLCSKIQKPEADMKVCVGDPCPTPATQFQWLVSETWSDCPCGNNNTQTRNATCQIVSSKMTLEGKVVTVEEADTMECEKLPEKPSTRRSCNGQPCEPVFRWITTDNYSQCDAACGETGQQVRELVCERVTFKKLSGEAEEILERAADQFCSKIQKPEADMKVCVGDPCPTPAKHFQWLVSEIWSDCPCGNNNTQIRNVTCQIVSSKMTSEGKVETVEEADTMDCEKLPEKHSTSRPCNGLPCEPVFRWIITDNFSQCDAACGEIGQQMRELVCERVTFKKFSGKIKEVLDRTDRHFCSNVQKPAADVKACVGDPCPTPAAHFQWVVSETWSDCPCGKGNTQNRNVTCEKVITQPVSKGSVQTVELADMEDCTHLLDKPASARPCNGLPCKPTFQWTVAESYGPCNAACGQTGQQARELVCNQVTLKKSHGHSKEILKQVVHRFCAETQKPTAKIISCIGDPCPPPVTHFRWAASETWSGCPCGKGNRQIRNVTCEKVIRQPVYKGSDQTAEETDIQNCAHLPNKPSTARRCNGPPCKTKYLWTTLKRYGRCKARCGKIGKQIKRLICQKIILRKKFGRAKEVVKRVHGRYCRELKRPKAVTRACVGDPCPTTRRPKTYKWQATENWGECQSQCGVSGTQTRLYTCREIGQDGRISDVADKHCGSKRPKAETKPCDGPPCPLQWSIGFWSQCSVTCGIGKRYRKVYCGDPDSDDDDYLCEDQPPITSRKCRMRACSNLKDENCRDMNSFCSGYIALRYRCKSSRFRRKCCQTCQDAERSTRRRKISVRHKEMRRYYK
ncbi:hypothetical protein RRG08_035806 [Elysia crispata]|uniref:Peptidase M12B domain-containing protein n=1 Tax=Elysia crispata TaxID=231223 RepID=A0AAE1D045_9GAST|nr:hypothetical protein RRG08_035806 [Elysia crispata]